MLEMMRSHPKVFPANFLQTFESCADHAPLFVAVKSAAVDIDRLKVGFLNAFGGDVPAEYIAGNFKAFETTPTAFMSSGQMTDAEIEFMYPLNAHREEDIIRVRRRSNSIVAHPDFDFEAATAAMRGTFNAELAAFEAQMQTEFRQYYATKAGGPALNVARLLEELDTQLAAEKEALRRELSAEIESAVEKVADSLAPEKMALEEELLGLARAALAAQSQVLLVQKKRLKSEKERRARKREKLLSLHLELNQAKLNAEDRYAKVGHVISSLRRHLAGEMNAIGAIGAARGMPVRPPVTVEDVLQQISRNGIELVCANLERDWRKLLTSEKRRKRKPRETTG
jgi:hypothetical protein